MKRIFFFLLLICIGNSYSQNLASLYKQINSSVVVINVIGIEQQSRGENIEFSQSESQGSGVLISDKGVIWTAAHVVDVAEEVSVEFLDGDVYKAEVITSNAMADVALIQIIGPFQLKDKSVAKIGDSDKVDIGEEVFVLGAPHGFKQSLSKGILSGRFFPDNLSNNFVEVEFLQTDAAINPGNSGGPMFNMKGEVIGIASRIYTNSGGFEGIGFAISSNVTKRLLMDEPTIWAGMESVLLSGNLARALNVPQEAGLLITKLSSKGAVSSLGLQGGYIPAIIEGEELLIGGDIILEISDIPIRDTNSLFEIRKKLLGISKGTSIGIKILRNGAVGSGTFQKL